jgi:cold shock CspA family protein
LKGGQGRRAASIRREGIVTRFDDHAGYGHVRGDDGSELFFHCTAIADGSRSIEVGALVTFDVVPGHHGRWEATALVARGASSPH